MVGTVWVAVKNWRKGVVKGLDLYQIYTLNNTFPLFKLGSGQSTHYLKLSLERGWSPKEGENFSPKTGGLEPRFDFGFGRGDRNRCLSAEC